ncbi:MAG: ferrous iron transport protein B [Christensenellales bacterium]
MATHIALAGNPNSGKTTMFNDLTGSNQYVGNWPGVTVEKKEGNLKGHKAVFVQDLPGIYSLSPYTMEEVIARNYLINDRPDAVINIVDASNIERNLYLTTQLLELGIPVVVALNMIDVVRKSGDKIDLNRLSAELGCPVAETSALRGEGSEQVAEIAVKLTREGKRAGQKAIFSGPVEHVIAHIEDRIKRTVSSQQLRWYAIKLFERDEKAREHLGLDENDRAEIEGIIKECEKEHDDDAESIITNERYKYVTGLVSRCVKRKPRKSNLSASDRIDRIMTSRWLGLPIFAAIMVGVYYIAVTSVGALVTDFTNDIFFGEWIIPGASGLLESLGVADWIIGLVVDGIIGGVGAVLGFVPQMVILFILLALLEECGYMARIAFIMDRLFRRFGLSGKSFIPMLISTGCGVPGVMASRTIESEKERRMTVMTATFMPCSAKLPIIALVASAIMGGAWWVAPSAYFIGMAVIVLSGIVLKKTKMFAGEPSPFVMELPAYHLPQLKSVARSTWDRSWSFIKRAGTVILISSIAIWLLSSLGMTEGSFGLVEDIDQSVLAVIGGWVAPLFAPLGFGTWQATVATVMGLIAKEEVVGVLGVLYGTDMGAAFTVLAGYSFLLFNLLCAPCFAAIGAIKNEMASPKWTAFAVSYQMALAYVVSLMVYQFGLLAEGGAFTVATLAALLCLVGALYLIFRRPSRGISVGKGVAARI